MNLSTDPWVPSLGSNDPCGTIEAALRWPLARLRAARPDLEFSALLLLIGLRHTGIEPPPLFGAGARFLQDERARGGREWTIGSLLLGTPGANARLNNTDLFQAREIYALCPSCATLALYAQTQFTGPAGPGFYPAPLYHCALYLVERDTLDETVRANILDGPAEPSLYFATPAHYWLEEPHGRAVCQLCGSEGPVVTRYWRRASGERPEPKAHPAMARTPEGRRYVLGPHATRLDVREGAAPGSKRAVAPAAVAAAAAPSEAVRIRCFSTCYDKATLVRMIAERFEQQPARDDYPARIAALAVWRARFPDAPYDLKSGLVAEVMADVAARIAQGVSPDKAAFSAFKVHAPYPRRHLRNVEAWALADRLLRMRITKWRKQSLAPDSRPA